VSGAHVHSPDPVAFAFGLKNLRQHEDLKKTNLCICCARNRGVNIDDNGALWNECSCADAAARRGVGASDKIRQGARSQLDGEVRVAASGADSADIAQLPQ
jgi:hypothetical protein